MLKRLSMENIYPHSSLQLLAENLWQIEGSLPHGVPLPRNMIIFRTKSGKLWIHSPVAVDESTKKEIDELGEVHWIVVPNDMHRMDAPTWKKAYPKALVLCPRAAMEKVLEKVTVNVACEEEFNSGEILAHTMAGAKRTELAYELRLKSGKALVINDLIVNVPALPGVLGKILKFTGRIGSFRVPTPQRFLFLFQRRLYKRWLRLMAHKGFTVVTVSHGKPVKKNVSSWLMHAANSL